jgi:putative membrane protein
MVEGQKEHIAVFEDAREKVKFPEMAPLIDKSLQVFKKHLQAVKRIAR